MAISAPPVAGAPPSAPVRRRPRGRASTRPSTTIWVAIVAAILAVLVNAVAVSDRGGVSILVAAREISLGEPVSPEDFRYATATLPDDTLAQVLRPGDLPTVSGQVSTHAIAVGQPVSRTDLATTATPDRQRAMSVPVDADHAVGGRLEKGDVVDIIDASTGQAVYVVAGAPVLDVGLESPGRGLSGSGRYAITVAVDAAAALRLSAAVAAGHLDVVRATGAVPIAVVP